VTGTRTPGREMQNDRPRLPDGWSPVVVFEDEIVADGVRLRRGAVSSTGPSGEEVTGAAVELAQSPVARGYWELLERVSTLTAIGGRSASVGTFAADGTRVGDRDGASVFPESDDPERWRYARSNGVAIHCDWRNAADRALWELAERDRVVRAWLGETTPELLPANAVGPILRSAASYDWLACSFPVPAGATFSIGVEVVGIFGFPVAKELPMVSGYGARPKLGDALDAAECEALQTFGFLWGEPVSLAPPERGPTPAHHLEHFQWPPHRAHVRRWLECGHGSFLGATRRSSEPKPRRPPHNDDSDVVFADLTPDWMDGHVRVVKALTDQAMPLVFGDGPFARHLPDDLRLYPIA
jgi:hypothetical protein